MEAFILILLIVALLMFIMGIAMVVLTIRFVKRKEHPLLSVLFSVLQCPCIYVPLNLTVGFAVAKIALVITFLYGVVVLMLSLKNIKMK